MHIRNWCDIADGVCVPLVMFNRLLAFEVIDFIWPLFVVRFWIALTVWIVTEFQKSIVLFSFQLRFAIIFTSPLYPSEPTILYCVRCHGNTVSYRFGTDTGVNARSVSNTA